MGNICNDCVTMLLTNTTVEMIYTSIRDSDAVI